MRDTNAYTDDDDDSYTDEYAYALDGCCSIPVLNNGVRVGIVIDSDASCNTMNADIAKQVKENGTPFNDWFFTNPVSSACIRTHPG